MLSVDIQSAIWVDNRLSLREGDKDGFEGIDSLLDFALPKDRVTARVIIANLWLGWRARVWSMLSRTTDAYTVERRYRFPHWTYVKVIRVLDTLVELGLVEQKKGYWSSRLSQGIPTKVRAGDVLADIFMKLSIRTLLEEIPYRELVELRRDDGTLSTYIDSKETKQTRKILGAQNRKASGTEIGLVERAGGERDVQGMTSYSVIEGFIPNSIELPVYSPYESVVNIMKLLRSGHKPNLMSGGRLYGAAWQQFSKIRRKDILIDGVSTVELDYSAQHPTICYVLNGAPRSVPEDVYFVEGFPREVVKPMLLMLLNTDSEVSAIRAWRDQRKSKKRLIPKEYCCRGKELVAKLRDVHAPILNWFCSNAWQTLQYVDSRMALSVLKQLLAQDILALPIHDSFIVKQEYVEQLHTAMDQASVDQIGVTMLVK